MRTYYLLSGDVLGFFDWKSIRDVPPPKNTYVLVKDERERFYRAQLVSGVWFSQEGLQMLGPFNEWMVSP